MTSEAKKAATNRYNAKTAKYYSIKLNRNTDKEIIEHLEKQPNIQGYLKELIRQDMKKEDQKMKTYIIKPEFLDKFGPEATAYTTLTSDDVENFAREWEMSETDLLDQLIEQKESGWTALYRFAGQPGWEKLNELIQFESGVEEPYCETEDDFRRAVKDGFIKFDGYYTTVWADE